MNKRNLLFFVIISAAACLCLVTALAGYGILGLPGRMSKIFGPPANNLNLFNRVYLSYQLQSFQDDLLVPRNPDGSSLSFHIDLGESTATITDRLQDEGFVRSSEALRIFLIYSGLDTSVQAGDYTLTPKMSAVEIAKVLQDATPSQVEFNLLPGWRLEEIAAALPTSGLRFSPQEFLASAHQITPGYSFSQDIPPGATWEGFLLPDSYRLARDLSVQAFIATLLNNFELQVTPELKEGFERQGLNMIQGVTLASLVEREAILDEEMPLIASVFLNRLAAGMKLDSDPTVQYALGYNHDQNTWWTNPLSQEDLQVNSPYNTYLVPSLPPGPIANPGFAALKAVADPAQTDYYYFRAACDGSKRHVFARTFEEHLNNGCP